MTIKYMDPDTEVIRMVNREDEIENRCRQKQKREQKKRRFEHKKKVFLQNLVKLETCILGTCIGLVAVMNGLFMLGCIAIMVCAAVGTVMAQRCSRRV